MNFKLFTPSDVKTLTRQRSGEVKFGESLKCLEQLEDLKQRDEQFVLFGIPENIGIKANYGNSDAHLMWPEFLNHFLNIQSNSHNHPEDVIVLGEFDTSQLQERASQPQHRDNIKALSDLVQELDEAVSELVKRIIEAKKTPLIIGGGHNNAYPIIKGVSEALSQKVNVLNIDAHTDYRALEHRHSGNGFSYADAHNYLHKYAVFGLHKNYTSNSILEQFDANSHLKYDYFEDILHLTALDKAVHFKSMMNFLDNHFGLEIDCDAIAHFPSSASSPSGFSLTDVRTFIKTSRISECVYLHICEASPSKVYNSGKALAYMVSDFIRKNK